MRFCWHLTALLPFLLTLSKPSIKLSHLLFDINFLSINYFWKCKLYILATVTLRGISGMICHIAFKCSSISFYNDVTNGALVSLFLTLTYFTAISSVDIAEFKHVNILLGNTLSVCCWSNSKWVIIQKDRRGEFYLGVNVVVRKLYNEKQKEKTKQNKSKQKIIITRVLIGSLNKRHRLHKQPPEVFYVKGCS